MPPPAAPPADNGGSPVTAFVVELCSGSERWVFKEQELQLAIHDLAPGTPYQVRIAATSDGGQGEVQLLGAWWTSCLPLTHPSSSPTPLPNPSPPPVPPSLPYAPLPFHSLLFLPYLPPLPSSPLPSPPPSLSVVQGVQSHYCYRTTIRASWCGRCGVTTATQYNSLLG